MVGSKCKAYQASCSMICGQCNQTWDINDPEPPKCLTDREIGNNWLKKLIKQVGDKCKKFN